MNENDCDYRQMKEAGSVNEYVERTPAGGAAPRRWQVVQLDAGTTPFVTTIGGVELYSNCHRLTTNKVTVTHAWYRPGKPEFDKLKTYDRAHVLKGGLLLAPLGAALDKQTRHDVTLYASWDAFCEAAYGVKPAAWQGDTSDGRTYTPKPNPLHDPYPVPPDVGGEGGAGS